jgi:Bacterial protein of unknown function (DUF839)
MKNQNSTRLFCAVTDLASPRELKNTSKIDDSIITRSFSSDSDAGPETYLFEHVRSNNRRRYRAILSLVSTLTLLATAVAVISVTIKKMATKEDHSNKASETESDEFWFNRNTLPPEEQSPTMSPTNRLAPLFPRPPVYDTLSVTQPPALTPAPQQVIDGSTPTKGPGPLFNIPPLTVIRTLPPKTDAPSAYPSQPYVDPLHSRPSFLDMTLPPIPATPPPTTYAPSDTPTNMPSPSSSEKPFLPFLDMVFPGQDDDFAGILWEKDDEEEQDGLSGFKDDEEQDGISGFLTAAPPTMYPTQETSEPTTGAPTETLESPAPTSMTTDEWPTLMPTSSLRPSGTNRPMRTSRPSVAPSSMEPTDTPTVTSTLEPTLTTPEPSRAPKPTLIVVEVTEEPTLEEIPLFFIQEPTVAPTGINTDEPTLDPTAAEIAKTEEPTMEPFPFELTLPTSTPSADTEEPTLQLQTDEPTAAPSKTTEDPTFAWNTDEPTPIPSTSPTTEPTNSITETPTGEPVQDPTKEPTPFPTTPPVPDPTPPPTALPTSAPVPDPTPPPTALPTSAPVPDPTPPPTAFPTSVPVPDPTPPPTTLPTSMPVPDPTPPPTASATLAPVPNPTLLPTSGSTDFTMQLPPEQQIAGSGDTEYRPGDLRQVQAGLKLSNGLSAKIIATSGKKVSYINGQQSETNFHSRPDAGACFEETRESNQGGWVYVSNSEVREQDPPGGFGNGGVGAITFDAQGNVIDYRMVLSKTSWNCGGGKTPWNTWISCEEAANGVIWQVDPMGGRAAQQLTMGSHGGRWESFAYDIRDSNSPRFFVTEDHNRGAVIRFTPNPDQIDWANPWNMLHGAGVTDYLHLIPNADKTGGRYEWTTDETKAKDSAGKLAPNCEGIDRHGDYLYFVSKQMLQIFVLNLLDMTYTNESTVRGLLEGRPDQIVRLLTTDSDVNHDDDILYFTEEGTRYSLCDNM